MTSREGQNQTMEFIQHELARQRGSIEKLTMAFRTAMVVATIFGAFGAWGYSIVSATKDELGELETALRVGEEQLAVQGSLTASLDERIDRLRESLFGIRLKAVEIQSTLDEAGKVIEASATRNISILELAQRRARDEFLATAQEDLAELNVAGQTLQNQLQESKEAMVEEIKTRLSHDNAAFLQSALGIWQTCAWHKVGLQLTHYPTANWCPEGQFISRMDFDTRGKLRRSHSWVELSAAPLR